MIATWVIQVYLILLKPKGTIESNPSFNRCINQGEVHQLAFCDVMSHTGHRCRNFAGPGVSQRRSRRQATGETHCIQRHSGNGDLISNGAKITVVYNVLNFPILNIYFLSLKKRQA